MKAPIETTFLVTIRLSYGASSISGAPTLAEAIATAFTDATYYLGHHERVTAEIEEQCAACQGDGEVFVKRGRTGKRVRCKACRGHVGPFQRIEFPCVPSPSVRTIDNGTGDIVVRVA